MGKDSFVYEVGVEDTLTGETVRISATVTVVGVNVVAEVHYAGGKPTPLIREAVECALRKLVQQQTGKPTLDAGVFEPNDEAEAQRIKRRFLGGGLG